MSNTVRVGIVVLVVLLVAACQPLPPAAPTAVAPATESSALSPVASPPTETAPAAPPADAQVGRFEIARPVKAGDTVVTGTGLAGMALSLYDLTNMGIELSGGVVGDDGRFTLQVPALTGNIRIGIQLVEQNDAIWAEKTLLGPEALVVPMVGAFVDTVLVAP